MPEYNFSETEKSYLAGIIDGEGCVAVSKFHQKDTNCTIYILKLEIASVDRELIDWILEKRQAIVSVSKTLRPCYHILWQNDKAKEILELTKEYLVIKKARAEFILKEYPKKGSTNPEKRNFCHKIMSDFNQRRIKCAPNL